MFTYSPDRHVSTKACIPYIHMCKPIHVARLQSSMPFTQSTCCWMGCFSCYVSHLLWMHPISRIFGCLRLLSPHTHTHIHTQTDDYMQMYVWLNNFIWYHWLLADCCFASYWDYFLGFLHCFSSFSYPRLNLYIICPHIKVCWAFFQCFNGNSVGNSLLLSQPQLRYWTVIRKCADTGVSKHTYISIVVRKW